LASLNIINISLNKNGLFKFSNWLRILIIGMSLVVFFLLDSRTGIVITLAISGLYFIYFKVSRKVYIILGVLVLVLLTFYNYHFVEERFLIYFGDGQDFAEVDGRSKIYSAFFEVLPDVFMSGVGNGNFKKEWGFETGFHRIKYQGGVEIYSRVESAHNVFFQLVIIGGISLLVAFLFLIKNVVRQLPSRYSLDFLQYEYFALVFMALLLMLLSHNIEAKEFSIAFALAMSHSVFWKE
jgi:hypothetical protein